MALALPEDGLVRFLDRQRRSSFVERPALAPFLAQTLELAEQLVPCEAGSLLLDDPAIKTTGRSPLTFVAAFGPAAENVVGVTIPPGHGIVGKVYESGTPMNVQVVREHPHFFAAVDEHSSFKTYTLAAAPIVLESQVCGILELINRRRRRYFSQADLTLVELLARYISRAILNGVDILKQNRLALRDDLTGLWNVRALHHQLAELVDAGRRKKDVAVLFIDVDHLKRLNDRLGHRAGSEALKRVAEGITQGLDGRGRAYRFGGDEFIATIRAGDQEAVQVAERIRKEVRACSKGPMRSGGRLPAISVSIGVATMTRLGKGRRQASLAERLLASADRALYRAKREGRAQVALATGRDDRLGITKKGSR